jgi:hypothetical protein
MTAISGIRHFLNAPCRFQQYNTTPAQSETAQPIAAASGDWVGIDQSGLGRVANMTVIDSSKKSSGAYTRDQDVSTAILLKTLT